MKTCKILGIAALLGLLSPFAKAVVPTPAEMAQSRNWAAAKFEGKIAANDPYAFYSFTYDGRPSAELLPGWELKRATRTLDDYRTEHTLTYTDPKTGLILRCIAVEFRDFPTLEWTLYFKNSSDKETPLLADIQAIDASFPRNADAEFTLHSIKGDSTTPDSYQPFAEALGPKAVRHMAPTGGRPTAGSYPYWNFEVGDKGFLVVLGWPGQWSARFDRDDDKTLRIRAGQDLTHFKLLPGEEVRSPLVAIQFYNGDWIRGQNLWRRWMVAHNLPRPGGKLVPTHYGACWSDDLHPRGDTEMSILNGYLREKIDLKYYFIDAGWYPGKTGNWWTDAGTWEVDKSRFTKGIREISDRAHANGLGFVLWFEPERAGPNTWLSENHPEWIIGGANGGLVNMGLPDAWKWIVDRIDGLIASEGVDVYRQDYNVDPLGYWRGSDAEDRQGITENKYVSGYLAFWDELRRRHPNLWIDSCASGGRRNDLETMRRSVPLLRSDCFSPLEAQQGQTYGLSLWIPYYGSGTVEPTLYGFRSCIFPASRVGWDTRKTNLDYAFLKKMIAEFHRVEPYLLSDYYPLTPYSIEKTSWIAWQFDEPGKGGAVQAFRRADCADENLMLKLQGLEPAAIYAVENLGDGGIQKMIGQELMETGLPVLLKEKPSAALFIYNKAEPTITWNDETGQARLTTGSLELLVDTKNGLNPHSLRNFSNGEIYADRDYSWPKGEFPKLMGAPVIAKSEIGNTSITFQGRLDAIQVEQTFTAPADQPGAILESITIRNPSDASLNTADFECGLTKCIREGEAFATDAAEIPAFAR